MRFKRLRDNSASAETLTRTSRFDKYLHRSSMLAQVLTPLLAIFGFWYTVLPLHSKSILEERVAQAQLELNSKNKELLSLESLISEKQYKIEDLEHYISIGEERTSALQKEINDLSKQRKAAEEAARKASSDSNRRYKEMRASVITAALSNVAFCLGSTSKWSNFYMAETRYIKNVTQQKMGARYDNIEAIELCLTNNIMHTFGIPQLSFDDTKTLKATLSRHSPALMEELNEIDLLLSNEHDTYLAATIFFDENKQATQKNPKSFSDQASLEQSKASIEASVDFTMGHMDRIRSLNSEAQNKLIAYVGKVRSDLIKLNWIE